MKTRFTKTEVTTFLSRVWLRSLLGALLAIVMAKSLVDWAQMHFEFLRYSPTIIVDRPVQVATPLSVSNANASPSAESRGGN